MIQVLGGEIRHLLGTLLSQLVPFVEAKHGRLVAPGDDHLANHAAFAHVESDPNGSHAVIAHLVEQRECLLSLSGQFWPSKTSQFVRHFFMTAIRVCLLRM